LGAFFTLTGLWLSYAYNLTSGAAIILVAAATYLLGLLWKRFIMNRPKIVSAQ